MRRRNSFSNDVFSGALIDAVMSSRRQFENRTPVAKLSGARFEITNAAANDTAELYIYGDIAFYDITAAMVAQGLADLTAKTLVVHLNSMGGEVFDGVAIYNLLRAYAKRNGAKIEVHIDALAASIASVIAEAGDEVIIARNAMMMIHRASGGCWGDADDMAAMGNVLVAIESDMIVPTYAAHTGIAAADLMTMMKASTWMNAQTCVDKGFADRLEDETGVAALLRKGIYENAPADLFQEAVHPSLDDPESSAAKIAAENATFTAKIRTRLAALSCEVA
jgi:ATP-dependent protease ClpP protease subunit